MKKLLLAIIAVMAALAIQAKVVKITLVDGTTKIMTSSEISAIDFNQDGTVTVTSYNGEQVTTTSSAFTEFKVGTEEEIVDERDCVLEFGYEDIHISSRNAHQINFVYPSTDPFGEPITLSGVILIPENIYKCQARSQGIILFNHYTIFNAEEAPTRGYSTLEGMFMANPLYPDYIVVESDFYGFGSTVRYPQAYLQGTANARASLDCLLAARRLLDEMGMDYGPLTFNVGYSSGGFDALSTQKLRDMEYADRISFDKTFAGGSPNDVKRCYEEYVNLDYTAYNAVLALLMVSTNDIQRMGLNYHDVFYPYIADNIDEWINSKKYSSWPVCDLIGREKLVHEMLQPPYCDLNSPESKRVQDLFEQCSIATGWEPDPTQRIFLMHSRGDDYVPVQSARPLIAYLKSKGFEPSIIPGKTNFQTNFVVPKLGHLTATIVYLVQTVAAIKAWPLMYTDGELNPAYKALVENENDPMAVILALENAGLDTRPIVQAIIAYAQQQAGESGQGLDINALLAMLESELGIDQQALVEMNEDSGLNLVELFKQLYAYYTTPVDDDSDDDDEGNGGATPAPVKATLTPAQVYEQQLRQWLDANGVK